MKCVLLAGGFGTRLSEYTDNIPKPMVEIGDTPMLVHIMRLYSKYNINDFIVSCGYKADYIKEYFSNYVTKNSDFTINFGDNSVEFHTAPLDNFKITFVDTGLDTMTGGRIKGVAKYLRGERFCATYGDGIADLKIDDLLKFHENHGKLASVTAVRPRARFGELNLENDYVRSFKEKPQLEQGWINGGFFVFENRVLEYISDLSTVLEASPLENLAESGELKAYRHEGFWQCMDTKRDRDFLDVLYTSGSAPWI